MIEGAACIETFGISKHEKSNQDILSSLCIFPSKTSKAPNMRADKKYKTPYNISS